MALAFDVPMYRDTSANANATRNVARADANAMRCAPSRLCHARGCAMRAAVPCARQCHARGSVQRRMLAVLPCWRVCHECVRCRARLEAELAQLIMKDEIQVGAAPLVHGAVGAKAQAKPKPS